MSGNDNPAVLQTLDVCICNWRPNHVKNKADWPKTLQVLDVTPDKKVVWGLRSWTDPADLGPASSI